MKLVTIFEGFSEQNILRKIVSRCWFRLFDAISELSDSKKVKHVGQLKYMVPQRVMGHLTDLGEVVIKVAVKKPLTGKDVTGEYDELMEEIILYIDLSVGLEQTSYNIQSVLLHELQHAYEFSRYYNFKHKSRKSLEKDNKYLKVGDEMTHYLTRKYEVSARLSQAMDFAADVIEDLSYEGKSIDNDVKREIILYSMNYYDLIDIFVGSKDGSIPYNNNLFRKMYGKILKYIDLKIERVNTIKREFNNEII